MTLKYRADIDGLRAIAVLAVILFHAGIPGFSGGFVGVDVFFVISGYLITSIILKDIRSGQFSISRFYERRIRRIFPALFPVIAFTTVVAAFLFDPIDFEAFGKSITATTFFGSNILFWSESGYFDAASITKPLLHTWSLAVEEQFYILFPLLLIAINRFSKKKYIPWILLGISLISFLTSIYGVYTHPSATFYLVPGRAWELLFGSFIALGVIPELQSNVHRNLFSFIGLGLIVLSVCCYTELTLFPGIAAFAPVMGASLIIYSGNGGGEEGSFVKKLLCLKPMVYIGLISYSLYLWHWPLLAFAKYLIFRDLTHIEITGIILATFLISALSLKFIEQPFRGKEPSIPFLAYSCFPITSIPNRHKLFSLSVFVMVIFFIIGTVIYVKNGIPGRYPEAESVVMNMKTDPQWMQYSKGEKNLEGLNKGNIPQLIGSSGGIPSYVIWGDSHAASLVTALSEMGIKYGLSGYSIAHGGIFPLLGVSNVRSGNGFNKAQYNFLVIDFIKARPEIKTVIIAGFWTRETPLFNEISKYSGHQTYSQVLREGMLRSINTLLKMGRNVVIVSDIPILKIDPNRFFYIYRRFNVNPDIKKIFPTVDEYQSRNKDVIMILKEIEKFPKVTIVHPESMLFDNKGNIIFMFKKKPIYVDRDHLSTEGSIFISPVFEEIFQKMANKK